MLTRNKTWKRNRRPMARHKRLAHGRTRVGAKARKRIVAGGPTSTHRPALSRAGYAVLSTMKFESQAGRCGWCVRVKPLQLEHAVKRSQSGPDAWTNTWGVCGGPGGCHDLKDRPYSKGRLLTLPLGGGLIDLLWVKGPSKHDYEILTRKVIGRRPTTDERAILAGLR